MHFFFLPITFTSFYTISQKHTFFVIVTKMHFLSPYQMLFAIHYITSSFSAFYHVSIHSLIRIHYSIIFIRVLTFKELFTGIVIQPCVSVSIDKSGCLWWIYSQKKKTSKGCFNAFFEVLCLLVHSFLSMWIVLFLQKLIDYSITIFFWFR